MAARGEVQSRYKGVAAGNGFDIGAIPLEVRIVRRGEKEST